MPTVAKLLQRIGYALFLIGLAAFASIFLIVMINGVWPAFLGPVQTLYAALGNTIGGFAFIVELAIFAGPGVVLNRLGQAIERSSVQNSN